MRSPRLAMIPDKIGNMGNTQGVNESSRPMPKKPVRISQKLPVSNICSILLDSVSMGGDAEDWNNSSAGPGLIPDKAGAAEAFPLTASATAPAAAFATGSVSSTTLLIGA